MGFHADMTSDAATSAFPALTDAERAAELSPQQLTQLVGLVEYDASADPFPVTGWDAVVFVVGNATPTAPARSCGASRSHCRGPTVGG